MKKNEAPTLLRCFAVACMFMVTAGTVQAQGPELTIHWTRIAWPQIELHYSVECAGIPQFGITPTQLALTENGRPVQSFMQECWDPATPCAISAALVVDASGSMAGTGNTWAKNGMHAFVDSLDGVSDEAAVLSFNQYVTMRQQLTTDTSLLHAAIDSIPAAGGTAVWDGTYAGIHEVVNNGSNNCRVVIALTDGGDNSSSRTPAEIVALAMQNDIRVCTIGIGGSINVAELESIAQQTGGRFFQVTNPQDLPSILGRIHTLVRNQFFECSVEYTAECPDGSERNVDLVVSGICGGSDTASISYRALKDTSGYTNVMLSLGEVEVIASATVTVPLSLVTALQNSAFGPLRFTLEYDRTELDFVGADYAASSILDSLPFAAVPSTGSVLVELQGTKLITGSGPLLDLTFRSRWNPADTTCVDLTVRDAEFTAGCLRPVFTGGQVCILPGPVAPELKPNCDVLSQLTYNDSLGVYEPNPFTVRVRCVNQGSAPAHDVQATLLLPPGTVLDPATQLLTKQFSPSTINRWQIGDPTPTLTWTLRWIGKPRKDTSAIFHVAVDGLDDTQQPLAQVMTECAVQVEGVPPEFHCTIEMPDSLVVNASGSALEPNPFVVRYTIENMGKGSGTVSTIALSFPSNEGLSMPPQSPNPPIISPNVLLNPGETFEVWWLLQASGSSSRRMPTITVTGTDAFDGKHICSNVLPIAALAQMLDGVLHIDPPVLRCDPDPPYVSPTEFTVTARLSNDGSLNLDDVWAELQWTDLSGLDLIELDPTYPDNSNPKTRVVHFPGSTVDFSWGFRLKQVNLSGAPQEVRFRIRYGSRSIDTASSEGFLTIDPRPLGPPITALGPSSICEGDSVILDAGAGYAAYLWNTGDTTQFISTKQAGQYFALVTMADSAACQARSDTLQVTVLPLPPVPVITQNGSILSTDPSSSWQWFLSGYAIAGARQQTYTATASGWYRVVVRNAAGCARSSDSVYVSLTGIDRVAPVPGTLSVYPNPTSGTVVVDLSHAGMSAAEIRIADMLGREVYRGFAESGNQLHRIDLSARPPGVYFIIVEGSERRMSATIVIHRD